MAMQIMNRLFPLVGVVLGLGLSILAVSAGESDTSAPAPKTQATQATHPIRVQVPSDVGQVDSGLVDINGRAIGVGCATCHESHSQNPTLERAEDFSEFHTDMKMAHGDQSCFACHDRESRDLLRMADGRTLAFAEAQTLCSQCHGPQARDWANGSHGGMKGYWDLTRGPRERGSCMSCHDSHSPAWPQVIPVFKPKDRFLDSKEGDGH